MRTPPREGPGHRHQSARLERGRARDRPDAGFRDQLRTNDDGRELYAQTKRELAQQVWRHVQEDYANARTAVVQESMQRSQCS
nr:GrpB family protein [Saccharopolyspora rectivirgula]